MSTVDLRKLFPKGSDGTHSALPKQRAFLQAVLDPNGPKYVAYYGGFGCLRGSTKIATKDGPKAISEIKAGDWVQAASSPVSYVQVGASYPKGRDRLYQVVHERGEFVCAAEHLTHVQGRGYLPAYELSPGLSLSVACLPDSISEPGLPVFELSAQHLIQTSVNFLDYCSKYCHQYGQLPHAALSNARELIPLLNDALKCSPNFERTGDLVEQLPDDNRPDQWLTLLSNYHSMCLSAHHAPALANYIASLTSEQTSGVIQALRQSVSKFSPHHMPELQGRDYEPAVCQSASKILSVSQLSLEEDYYDLEVLSTGHYVDSSGVIHHNSGKSVVLCAAILTQAVVYGGDYLVSRHFMPELRRTTMKTFLDMCPKELILEVRVADAEVHLRSRNGTAIVYFIGLDEPGKIDSMNLSGFAIDEASQTTEEAFLKLQGRLRNPKGLRKGLLVGNPKGRDHVYRHFVSKVAIKPESHKNYLMIVAPSTENVHLPEGYIEGMLSSYSKERVQRDIMGSFDSFEGMIYDDFSRAKHVIEPFEIPDSWTRIVGADHGFTNPAAFLWGAIDHDGNVYIYRELYRREALIKDLCTDLKRLIGCTSANPKGSEKIDAIYIDPSTKARRGQTGVSDFSTYLEHLPSSLPLIPAQNDVTSGIDRVKTYLRDNPKTKKPRLFIFSSCLNLIEEIGEYRWAELSANQEGQKNQKEEPRKYNDHAVDALRYLVMSRPDPSKKPEKDKGFPTMESAIQQELASIRKPKEKDPFGDY